MNITIGGQDFTGIDEGCDTTNTTAFIWWSTWWVLSTSLACCVGAWRNAPHGALCGALQPSVMPNPPCFTPALPLNGRC